MPNFGDLERAARARFGDRTVDDVLAKRPSQRNGGEIDSLVSAERVVFTARDTVQEKADDALTPPSEQPDRVSTLVGPMSTNPDDQTGPDAKVGARNVAASSHSAEILGAAVRGEYLYAMLGLVLGLAAIIGGVVLCIHGVAGATSWSASFLGLSSKINDAAPGVVLFIVGLFMIVATKPKVRLRDLKG